MRILLLAVVSWSICALAAPPPCATRVQALKTLADGYEAARKTDPVEVRFFGDDAFLEKLEYSETWKTQGLRLLADKDASLEAKALPALVKTAQATKLELCIELGAKIEQKQSLTADPKLVAPLLKKIADMLPADRATVLAGETAEGKFKCKGITSSFKAAGQLAPGDRIRMLLQATAESLEECKCPSAEAERAFAVLTLMADVWKDQVQCAPVVIKKSGTALKLPSTVKELVEALTKAGAAGVELK